MKKNIILICISILATANSFSQPNGNLGIDSLIKITTNVKQDTLYVKNLIKLAEKYNDVDNYTELKKVYELIERKSKVLRWLPGEYYAAEQQSFFYNSNIERNLNKSKFYATKIIKLGEYYKMPQYEAKGNSMVSNLYGEQGIEPDSVMLYTGRALAIYKSINFTKGIIVMNRNIGMLHLLNNRYNVSLPFYLEALKLAENSKDTAELINIYIRLIDLHKVIGDYDKAINYVAQVKLIAGNRYKVNIDTRLADVYFAQGNYAASLPIREKEAAVNYGKDNLMRAAQAKYRLASVHLKMGNYLKGVHIQYDALQLVTSVNNIGFIPGMKNQLAEFYNGLATLPVDQLPINDSIVPNNKPALLSLAATYLESSIEDSKRQKNYEQLSFALENISNTYSMQGKAPEALSAFKQLSFYKDSLLNLDQKDSIRRMQLSYEFSKKTDSVNTEKKLQLLESEKQTALAALAFEYDKKELLAKTALEKLQLQQEETLKRSGIENDFNMKQANLIALQKNKDLNASLAAQQQAEKLKNQKIMGIGIITALAFAGLWFFMYNRSKQRKLQNKLALQEANQKLRDAEYATKINNVTFDALRSQMNPHFIFNCLNSIKLYTEQNNRQVASTYLDKFSSLIRSVLDNARTEQVTLNNEIESLRLYLDLESMRFKDKLSYTININSNVDIDFVEIPPMLIQPYVENAIWHGLMHKPEGGTITLDFAQENDVLQATVTDTGIGRTQAAAIKANSNITHKSLGTQITHERISLINKRYNTNARVVLSDVVDSSNNLAGTRATIQIPVI